MPNQISNEYKLLVKKKKTMIFYLSLIVLWHSAFFMYIYSYMHIYMYGWLYKQMYFACILVFVCVFMYIYTYVHRLQSERLCMLNWIRSFSPYRFFSFQNLCFNFLRYNIKIFCFSIFNQELSFNTIKINFNSFYLASASQLKFLSILFLSSKCG